MQKEVIVTGVKHYKGINAFDVGNEVVVEFDSENPYSNNAFKVSDKNKARLGSVAENPSYIPRKICSDLTILAKELKQLVNNGFKIVSATVKEIVRNYAILTVELKEPTIEETKDENVVVLPRKAKESIYTVVGTKYHSTNANVGDIVRFKVVNGTTTLFNENGDSLGVLPQSDEKIGELQSIEAPIVLNQVARTDFNTLENVFVVSYVVEDKYIFLRELNEYDLIDNEIEAIEKEIALLEAKKEKLLAKKEVETMELKDLLKEEFEDVEISGKAWDIAHPLNQLSRDIKAIIGEHTSSKTTIMGGNGGKFVWIQYENKNAPLSDGGVASGSIEDYPIHLDGKLFYDINYSKIAFGLIPVDDF